MTKLMNTWPSTAGRLKPGRLQKGSEHVVNLLVGERFPFVRNEDMVATSSHFLTARQVATETHHCCLVQRYQPRFLKLGSADQQTLARDIGHQQM